VSNKTLPLVWYQLPGTAAYPPSGGWFKPASPISLYKRVKQNFTSSLVPVGQYRSLSASWRMV